MSEERQLRNRRSCNNEKTPVPSFSECGNDFKIENIIKDSMDGDKRSCLRRREFRDTSSVVPERGDMSGRGKAKVDNSEEAEIVGDVKDAPVKSQVGEDESTTSGLPAKRRRVVKQVQESLAGQESLEEEKQKGKAKKKGKGKKKSSKKSNSKKSKKKVGAKEAEDKFEVEKILKVKVLKNGKKEFLIHWKGFSAEYDSWEPESNLDCKDLVDEYFEEHEEEISTDGEEGDTDQSKSKTGKSSRSTRSKTATSTEGAENNETGDTKKGRKTARRTSGKRKRSGTRERKPRAASVRTSEDESLRADTRKADEGNIDVAEKSEVKEAADNSQKSSSAEVGEPSGVAENEDPKEYEVERILDVRHLKDGTREFLIKWRGFAKKYNSWEPEANMNCTEKVQKFLKALEEASTERELRVDRKKTSRFTLDDERRGRKMSLRLGKMPRKSYNWHYPNRTPGYYDQ